jgi:hypothetical protein
MARRISLPMTDTLGSEDAPTTATMRKRLGGRVTGEMSVATPRGVVTVGSFVELSSYDGTATKPGVLLTVEGDAVDVYMSGGLVRRTRAEFIAPKSRAADDLIPVAESAAVFARLGEGQAVEVERGEGTVERGTLVEKCRYGALVKLANDVVLAVGFRKVWPAVVASQSQS